MSPTRSLSAFTLVCLSLVGTAAEAQQRAPNACVSSAPASLMPTTRRSHVSAVVTGSDTLWVLYDNHDARNIDAVSLLEVRNVGNAHHLEVDTHDVGEGSTTANSLAVVDGHLVGAWVQPDRHVGVFSLPLRGHGDMQHTSFDAPQSPTSVSVASTGHGAIVTWDDNGRGLRVAHVDANGSPVGTVVTMRGRYGMPVATSAFGGAVVLQNGAGAATHLAMLPANARRTLNARGAASLAGAAFPSVTAVGDRAHAAFVARGTAHVTTIDNATGAGRDHALGPAGMVGETGIAGMPWGSYAAWTRDGVVNVVPVEANGSMVGLPFEVTDPASNERARSPAVATSSQIAAVVWWGTPARRAEGSAGAIRFVRLDCH